MKFLNSRIFLWSVVFLTLPGFSRIWAQDAVNGSTTPAPTPAAETTPIDDSAASDEATPVPVKPLTTRQKVQALEDENQNLEQRLKAVEDQMDSFSAQESQRKGNDDFGVSEEAEGDSGPNMNTGKASGIHDTFINLDQGNEYIYDTSRVLTFSSKNKDIVFNLGGRVYSDFNFYFQPLLSFLGRFSIRSVFVLKSTVSLPCGAAHA